jgi:cellulose synthase/poly-beta-1,6-N-acetylglucosamine synthase-like glycosyltransferase
VTAQSIPWVGFLLALYYLVLSVLAVYGLHRLVLLAVYFRTRKHGAVRPPDPATWPRVTVQLPIFNERYVATRLIDAVCAFDYPRDRLEIQVLDDSTDDTTDRIARRVAHYRARGLDIHHLHRRRRTGYKAGALAAGCQQAQGELLAVFDADFVPPPEFLRETVPHFADPRLGVVQARWEHVNREYSLLTRAQAIFLDAHFLIEHVARNRAGHFFNFNGTAGIWRREAIVDAGGWHHDTLTEDLDLSYRAQLAGWRFLFLPEVTAPAELPVDVNAFKRQQFRWAKGSIQTARKLLGPVLRSDLPWSTKVEATIHLTNNAAYLLMVLLSLLGLERVEQCLVVDGDDALAGVGAGDRDHGQDFTGLRDRDDGGRPFGPGLLAMLEQCLFGHELDPVVDGQNDVVAGGRWIHRPVADADAAERTFLEHLGPGNTGHGGVVLVLDAVVADLVGVDPADDGTSQ